MDADTKNVKMQYNPKRARAFLR